MSCKFYVVSCKPLPVRLSEMCAQVTLRLSKTVGEDWGWVLSWGV